VSKAFSEFISCSKHGWDTCADSNAPSVAVEQFKKEILDAKNRGARIRFLTEVINDNIDYCKELAKIVGELRHSPGIKGNFSVSKSEYLSWMHEAQPIAQLVHSNVQSMVERHEYLFETLWSKSKPFVDRIKEVEGGEEAAALLRTTEITILVKVYTNLNVKPR